MPAYRSAAEAEVRDAVVARLRILRPGARIIHEINASGFGNRIDVLAVDRAEIIAVEIKSEKDKLDRLPTQIVAMRGAAHHVIAALHEKHLPTHADVGDTWVRDDLKSHKVPPKEAKGAKVWAYPEVGSEAKRSWGRGRWEEPKFAPQACLPSKAIDMLWRAELLAVCDEEGVSVGRRATSPFMVSALRWTLSGGDLTKAICRALRRRNALEADPPINDPATAAHPAAFMAVQRGDLLSSSSADRTEAGPVTVMESHV